MGKSLVRRTEITYKEYINVKKIACSTMVLAFITSTQIFAASARMTIELLKNTWIGITDRKETANQTAYARCMSVYPTNNATDNYTKIKCRCSDYTGNNCISSRDEYVLYETDRNYTSMSFAKYISKGTYFVIDFKGNKPDLAAYADVMCNFN